MAEMPQLIRRWKVTYASIPTRICSSEILREYAQSILAQFDAAEWGDWRFGDVLTFHDSATQSSHSMLRLECWTLPGVWWSGGPGEQLSVFERCLNQFNEFESIAPPFTPATRNL